MKKLLSALLIAAHIVALAPPSRAAYPTADAPWRDSNGAVSYPQSRVSRSKRILVVFPKRWDILGASTLDAACDANGVYQCMDMAREQGADVHYVNSKVFENYTNGTYIWRNIGDNYALVIYLNPLTPAAGDQRYWNADSTNAQVLVVGGRRTNGNSWTADTTSRGQMDAIVGLAEASSTTRYSCLVPYTSTGLGTDTVWANALPTGKRVADSAGVFRQVHSGITRVVRILHPVLPGTSGVAWSGSNIASDTTTTQMPASTDSVAQSYEYLGPIWRVEYANGRSTWYYKFASTNTGNVHDPTLLWGVICRFVDVDPIRYAVDWDDVTNVNDSNNYPRWRNTQAESALAALRNVGITPSNAIDPGNAPGYIGGTTPSGESGVAWVGDAHTYLKKLNWIHHAHDSTNSRISSNLVGGYGGYAPSNGPIAFGNGNTGRRFASRYNPGQTNPGNWMGAGAHFGIVQRLAYSDSVRSVWSPLSQRPPYMTFPANEMLPVNWRTRGAVAGYTPTTVFACDTASCPMDSVLWALDYGLNGRQTAGKGEIWLRSGQVNAWRNEAPWADRDSFVAASIAMYPRERVTTRIGSRLIQAEVLHSFNQGIGNRSSYVTSANYRAGYLLGLNNKVQMSQANRPLYGEALDGDMNTLISNSTGKVNFMARQSTRIVYQHPGQQTVPIAGATGSINNSSGDLHTEILLRGIIATLRVADAIAGRKASQCVMAWNVYDRK